MTTGIDFATYDDALVVLGTAGVVVPMVHRFGVSPVLAYLIAGAVLGPLGFGSLATNFTLLRWITVTSARNVEGIAELGVVFLLFVIGLEMSTARVMAMRRLVLGLGGVQVVLCGGAIGGVLVLAGLDNRAALVLGAFLALSSTAIVLEVLARQGRVGTQVGRVSFAVLVAQDIAVIPILIFVSTLGARSEASMLVTLGLALLQAAAVLAAIVVVGSVVLRPLFRLVARTKSSELFIAALLFVIVGTGVAAAAAGLSMALGAFVAGLLLAGGEYRKAIHATIEPFQGLLLGIFFFTVGMNIDPRELAREPLWLVASVVGLIVIKALIVTLVGRMMRLPWAVAFESGLLLGPGGEFAFVGIGLAAALGIVPAQMAGFATAVVSVSMLTLPLLASFARSVAPRMAAQKILDPALSELPAQQQGHAIVVGHGRVGQVVCDMLARHKRAFVAADNDASAVTRDRKRGMGVYYGNAADPAFLNALGLKDAAALIVTIHARQKVDEIVTQVRALRPDLLIFARALDADHASHLYSIGVSDAVPETLEGSLQLSEAVLVGMGIPTGFVIASIHEKRDEFRHALQTAANAANLGQTRAIRAKRLRPG